MITIIAGSRNIKDYNLVKKAIKNSGFEITKIISGGADGVDKLAIRYALENGISFEVFPVTKEDWKNYGRKAGVMRNLAMAQRSETLVAIWDSKSKGTKDMILKAMSNKLQFFIYKV